MEDTKIQRIRGNIFDITLQDKLRLDGLLLHVRRGFNPLSAEWMQYKEHPNPRIDANTGVFEYNHLRHDIPTRDEFPVIIAKELSTIISRGV